MPHQELERSFLLPTQTWMVCGNIARRLQLLEEVSEQAKDLSGQIFTYQLDVQDAEQCKVIAEKFIEQPMELVVQLQMPE